MALRHPFNLHLILLVDTFMQLMILHTHADKTTNQQRNFFKECPPNHDVKEGGPLVLSCQQNEIRNVIYTWAATNSMSQGGMISPENEFATSARRSYQTNGPAGHLSISKVDRIEDDRIFYCVAHHSSNAEGEEPQPQQCPGAKVTVYYVEPEIKVERIDQSPQSSEVGSNVKLRCVADAKPRPTIVWFFNGKQIKTSSTKFSQSVSMSADTITLLGIKTTATGTYSCLLKRGSFGDVYSQLPYVLRVIATHLPRFTLSDRVVQYLSADESAQLKCSASVSSWSVRWSFTNNISNLSNRKSLTKIASSSNDGFQIHSYDPRSMQGFYLCELSGKPLLASENGAAGETVAKITIQFLYEVVTAENNPLDRSNNFEPPLRPDKPFVIRENSTFTLRVYVDFTLQLNGRPKWAPIPKLKWKKPNGNDVIGSAAAGNDVQVIHKRSLYIPNAKKEHTGVYTLELINQLRTETNEARIIVAFQPRFRRNLTDLVVQEGNTAKFVCPLDANDCNDYPISQIFWMREIGKQKLINITASSKYLISQTERVLTIQDVAQSDAGKYRCRVITIADENESGLSGNSMLPSLEAKSNAAHLKVTKKLKWLQSTQNYLEVEKQGSLTCAAEGEGQLTWKFYLRADGKLTDLKNEGDTYLLDYVHYHNRGNYECSVTNSANEMLRKQFTVAVGMKPTVIMDSKNISSFLGASQFFNCKGVGKTVRADNEPVPLTISWMFKPFKPPHGKESSRKEMALSITGANYRPESQAFGLSSLVDDERSRETLLPNVVLYPNGTLQIFAVDFHHVGSYRCLVSNNYTLVYSEWVHLSLKGGTHTSESNQESDLLRTVLIVVGCAIVYISMVIVLTVYCSFRMWRRKAKRNQLNQMMEAAGDNRKQEHSLLPMENYRLLNGTKKRADAFEMEFTACSQGPASIATSGSIGSGTQQTVPAPSLDTRSCVSGGSGGAASSLLYGVAFGGAGTPANSTIESTVERLCHKYQKDRRRDFLLHKGLLGRGLFGEVRLGNALHFSQVPADSVIMLKYLTTHDANLNAEFINQIRSFAKFDHVNVTKLLGVCTESGQPPICILEYCEHGNLLEFLQNMRENYGLSALHQANQLHMFLQIASAMEHMHSLGHVHRDLAAHNILVSRDFNLKVTNLGPCLDRFVGHYYGPLRKHHLLPIRWLPPEVILHDAWTLQTDVWSFGILVSEILNYGQLPYANLIDCMILEAANRGALLPEECFDVAGVKVLSCWQDLLQVLRCCWMLEASQRPSFQQICVDISRIASDSASV